MKRLFSICMTRRKISYFCQLGLVPKLQRNLFQLRWALMIVELSNLMTRSPISSSRGLFQTASSRGWRRATFADGSLLYIYIYIYIKKKYPIINNKLYLFDSFCCKWRFYSGLFTAASILYGCGGVSYLLTDRLEKRQMWGEEAEKIKIKGERKKKIRLLFVWAAASEINCDLI